MSLFGWIGRKITLRDGGFWGAFFGGESYTGKPVTPDTALQLAAVWACVRVTAQAVATLPVHMFERQPNGGRTRVDHPLAEIIGDSPNEDLTSLEFWEGVTAWLCTWGNSYAEIVRSGDRIVALNLLPSDRVQVIRDLDNRLTYVFTDRGQREELPRDRVLHIKGFGFGGDLGLSPIRFGVQTMGTAIAADEAAGRSLGSGMMTSGVLTPKEGITLDKPQREQLREILQQFAGSKNAGKSMILPGAFDYHRLSLDPEAMQLLETRRFNVEDVCRWFGVPPIIIGHAAQGQTMWGSGVEALVLQWLTTGLNPFLERIERRISKQLLAPGERRRIYAEFNREALLAMDSEAKAKFLSTMVQNALMSRNEARSKLNLPAVDGGDALTAQTNLAPLDRLGASDPRAEMRNALGIDE